MVRVPRAYAVNKQYLVSSTSAQPSSDCLIRRPGDDPPESEQCLLLRLPASQYQSRIAAMPSMFHLKEKSRLARPSVGFPQSPVAIAIYSPGPRANCHSADNIGVGRAGQGREGSFACPSHYTYMYHLLSVAAAVSNGMI
jgi:hypothetical protein